MSKSILQTERVCWFCGTTYNLHKHHVIYGRGNRAKSEHYGLTVYLCQPHHTAALEGVHFNAERDLELKKYAQKAFEARYGHEKFMEEFGKNYL